MNKFDFFGSISSDLPISIFPGINSTKKPPIIPIPQKSQPQTLPPDLLIRILRYLPITSLPNFARACRRFKVLVYDDELWEQHLKTLGVWKDYGDGDIMNAPVEPLYVNAKHTVKPKDDKFSEISKLSEFDPLVSPPASPITPNNIGNLLDFAITTANSLSLIPGLPPDPLSQKSRSASTGVARASFRKIYVELLPYYLDFRHRRKDSKLFKEYNDPSDQAKMLARLLSFGKLNITLDSDQINNALETTIEYFENSALHHFELAYNAQSTAEMQKWANILLNLNGGLACIQVFIQKNSIFFDHLYDPMDNFTYLSTSHGELNFMQMTEFFNYVEEEFKKQAILINQIFPQDADVFYTFVERVVEDVIIEYISILLEESHNRDICLYLKATVAAHQRCIHVAKFLWKESKPGLTKIRAEDLMYQMFEPFMDKYLKEEMNYVRAQSEEEIEKWNQKLMNKSIEAQQAILNNANREVYKRNYLTSFRNILKLPTARSRHSSPVQSSTSSTPRNKRSSAASIASSNPTLSPTDLQSALLNAKLDKMQQMLSLETALQMVHVNKDSLRRISAFTGYPDKMGFRIKETLESIFILLLQTLGPLHIKPAFETAIKHLGEFKSDLGSESSGLAPLVEFFELVHIADLIQQMVQVYYDEEMNKFIDKTDFLNNCNKEKKIFEKILDESVAAGLNKGIQVLIDHVEFILSTEQKPEEFNPASDDSFDLQPTKACIDAVQCLSNHTKLVVGCSDKHTLDVFFQEIGLRFFGALTKHIKKFTVSLSGGFQVISDLNHYCSFIISLRQPNITPYFIALKELGNIYIISNAHDIGSFVRESERFNGILHAEDVYEFCQKREDWITIKKEVDKELYGLKAEDCTIM
ncbi:exocyst complex component Sec10-domain-containing protein [Glomus cerebriforme]|uniref:Exocyst complex component Sec10-domain-containing protein n=1 Tax=Glomus cerebriforme TaxID=658196 RepID=A0A397THV0_9GLOM|nr:exocyst complex component Sec10-domain-containing protein [Glomus cerebriforme]